MPVRSKRQSARRTSSKSDAIAVLKKDHAQVKKLLKRLENTGEDDAMQRKELLQHIEKEVQVHTTIEEEIFYPAFKNSARTSSDEELYFEAMEEHHVVELVMPEIKEAGPESEQFGAKAKVLKDLIEHHAEEEEKQMFPKARKILGAARLRDLGQELMQRKQQLTGAGNGRGREGSGFGKLIGRMGTGKRNGRRAA